MYSTYLGRYAVLHALCIPAVCGMFGVGLQKNEPFVYAYSIIDLGNANSMRDWNINEAKGCTYIGRAKADKFNSAWSENHRGRLLDKARHQRLEVEPGLEVGAEVVRLEASYLMVKVRNPAATVTAKNCKLDP